MKILGYTKEKEVFQVDLSIEEIVEREIDPWRIDLFDSAPVKLLAAGRRKTDLYFRRLRDIAFAYRLNGKDGVVASHDGAEAVVSSGTLTSLGGEVELSNVRTVEESFTQHWLRYLLASENRRVDGYETSSRELAEPCEGFIELYQPRPPNHLYLRGAQLRFSTGCVPEVVVPFNLCVGEMFEKVDVKVDLDEHSRWVLKALSKWKPIVSGESVRKSMLGQPVSAVRVLIDMVDTIAVRDHLKSEYGITCSFDCHPDILWSGDRTSAASGSLLEFTHNGCFFVVAPTLGMNVENLFHTFGANTANCLYTLDGEIVHGSRIAFFDIGKDRSHFSGEPNVGSVQEFWWKRLVDDGYTLIGLQHPALNDPGRLDNLSYAGLKRPTWP